MVAVLGLVMGASLMGCHYEQWRALKVGQSTAANVQQAFKTPVQAGDRYAYAFAKDKKLLMMVNLDENGIVRGKYYWHSAPAGLLSLWRTDTWKMALATEVAPSELQQYSAAPGPREEAILQYFGEILFDTSRHFEQINEVTESMAQILTLAADKYRSRDDKETLLSKGGFSFDGGIFGNKCTMVLETVDGRQGLYMLVVQGYRARSF